MSAQRNNECWQECERSLCTTNPPFLLYIGTHIISAPWTFSPLSFCCNFLIPITKIKTKIITTVMLPNSPPTTPPIMAEVFPGLSSENKNRIIRGTHTFERQALDVYTL